MDMAEGLADENAGPSSQDKAHIKKHAYNVNVEHVSKCSKKRIRNPEAWKRVRQKKARISGKDYINVRGNYVPARAIGPDCNCKLMCYKQVDENMRNMIFEGFYDLKSYDEQNAYLFGLIRKQDIKRKTKPLSARRTCTYKYFLRFRGREINVCKVAFARIHSISAKKIRGLCEKLDQNILFPKDGRGKHSNRPQRILPETRELIRRHMYNLLRNPQVREYFKEDKNQPNSSDLNITKMYKHFLLTHDSEGLMPNSSSLNSTYNPKVKMWLYRNVFHDEFRTKDFHSLKKKVDLGYKLDTDAEEYALHQKVFKRGKRKGMKPQRKQSEFSEMTLESITNLATDSIATDQLTMAPTGTSIQQRAHNNQHELPQASTMDNIGVQTIMHRFSQIKTDPNNVVAGTSGATTATIPATAVIHLPVNVSFATPFNESHSHRVATGNDGTTTHIISPRQIEQVTEVIMDTGRNQMVQVQRQMNPQTINIHKLNYAMQDGQNGTHIAASSQQNYQIFQATDAYHTNVFSPGEHPIYHLDKNTGELISLRPIRIASSDLSMQIPTGY